MADKSTLENTVAQVLGRWREAEGKIRLYGPNMPQSQPVIENLHRFLQDVFRTIPSFSLVKTTRGLELMVHTKKSGNKPLSGNNESEVTHQGTLTFDKFKLQSITFHKGLTLDELNRLFSGLYMPTVEASKPHSLAHYLQKHHIRHIELDTIHVKLLKDGDKSGSGSGSGGISVDAEKGMEDLLKQMQSPTLTNPKSFSSVWENYLTDQLNATALKTEYAKLLHLAQTKPEILVRVIQHLAAKQEKVESFLANLEQKLFDVGFPEDTVAHIKSQMLGSKQVMIDEGELARLRLIERLYQPNLKERIEQSLQQINTLQQKLTDERERGEAIVRQSSQGIMVLNKEGQIITLNSIAEKVLGISAAEAMGKRLDDVTQDHHMVSVVSNWESETDQHIPKQVEIKAGNSEVIDAIRESALVIEDENGRSIGGVSALQNVAHFQEMERRKNDILDVLGHDLRAPLNIVKQNIDLMADFINQPESLSVEEQAEFMEACKRHIGRMEKMINKILDVRQLETGKVVLKKDRVQSQRILEDASHSLDSWAADKDITIEIDAGPAKELYCDPERIYQVITNLVSNALKFTPEGGLIRVTSRTVESGSTPAFEVSVTDSGIGIHPEDLTRIFNKYEQVSLHRPKGVSGLGLGLSTCKTIIELHQGQIWADSVMGQSSTFTFRLPINIETGEEESPQ